MKKRFLGFLLLPLILSGCGAATNSEEIDTGSYETHSIEHPLNTGEIAAFDLLTPTNEFSTGGAFSFTWEVANNANYYNLEIASTLSFVSDDEDEVYVRETNLSNTKFDLTYYLPKKDITGESQRLIKTIQRNLHPLTTSSMKLQILIKFQSKSKMNKTGFYIKKVATLTSKWTVVTSLVTIKTL